MQEKQAGTVRWVDALDSGKIPEQGEHESSSRVARAATPQPMSQAQTSGEHLALLKQAAKSIQDHAGRYRCLGCGRMCGDLASLCQHLKDRHRGVNSASAPGSVNAGGGVGGRQPPKLSLGDFLNSGSSQRGARITPARDLQLTERQIRNVRGFVKAHPNKQDLVKAIKGRLRSSSGKKKLSRLKRLILREKTDKAVEAAMANVSAAEAAARKAEAAHVSVSRSLQDAKLKLGSQCDGRDEARLPPTLVTEVQILEMALAEAGRRVAQTSRRAAEAEEALQKAQADQAKAWRRGAPGAKEEAAASPQATKGPHVEERQQEEAAAPTEQPSGNQPMPRSHGSQGKAETPSRSTIVPPAVPAVFEPEAKEEDSSGTDSDDDEEDMHGLQGFEDVLASWLHDANQKTLALGVTADLPPSNEGADAASEELQDGGWDVGSQTDSDGLGPEGWDDVLSAWMTNAGILGHQQQHRQEQEPPPAAEECGRTGNGKAAHVPAAQLPAPSAVTGLPPPPRATTPAQQPVRQAIDVQTPVKQSSAFDYLISPKPPSGANLSPRSTIPNSPGAASYGSLLLGAGSEASFSLGQDVSLGNGNRGWLGGPPPACRSTPGSRLTGGLGSGQLSPESVVELRASLAENSFLSDDEGVQQGFGAAARMGNGGRLHGFPSRHSDLGTASLHRGGAGGMSGSSNAGQPHSWGPWSGSTNINAGRWSDSGTSLPRLQSADPTAFRGFRDATFEEARAGLQGMSLLERTASVGAVPGAGVPRSHTVAGNLQSPRLYGSAMSVGQRQSPLHESYPLQSQLSGPSNHAFGSLASMNSSALDESVRGSHSWMSIGDLQASEAGHGASLQQNGYLNGQHSSPHHDALHQSLQSQLQPILSSQWEQPGNAPMEPSPFQVNHHGGPMLLPEAHSLGEQQFLRQEQGPLPFGASHSHQQLLLEQARLSQNIGLDLHAGLFPDSFPGGPHQHANLPHYHSYPGPQPTPQGMAGMHAGLDGSGNMFALRHLLSEGGGPPPMYGDLGQMGQRVSGLPGWNGTRQQASDLPSAITHDFHCTTCNVSCCGLMNYQQHCNSKRHLRKTAAAAAAVVSEAGSPNTGDEDDGSPSLNPTYVGLQAQCRNYCKQVITTDLNRVVVDLLQQLLFWQDRSKAINIHNAARKKRLVSGLREVAKAIRLGKAKTIIVTPNIEKIEAEGGLDELLTSILVQAEQTQCPIVFALSRKKLGQIFGCRKKMSAIAILDYGGAEDLYREMEQLAQEGRREWETYRSEGITPPTADDVEASANSSIDCNAKAGPSRPGEVPTLPVLVEGRENVAANFERSPFVSPHQSNTSVGNASKLPEFGGMSA